MNRLIKVLSVFGTRPEAVKMAQARNSFGDGLASRRIVEAILYKFNIRQQEPEQYI